jgi:Protein of unknown function (DUF2794)
MAEEASNRQRPTLALVSNRSHSQGSKPVPAVGFDRHELQAILNLYGRKVSAGEWRDYAMDFLRERAVFSVYARASEHPLYSIEKQPKLRNRQGQYMVMAFDGRILKRGHELQTVLRVLEPKLALVE